MVANITIHKKTVPTALTIAGSDSGGGAGIQADLKAFTLNGVHGTCAITCVTAQNTKGVTRIDPLPIPGIIAQIQAVISDIEIHALKTGMLLNEEIIQAVGQQINQHSIKNIVIDPVMVSRTGAQLLDNSAITSLKKHLIPHATILTPNRHEAQLLSGIEIQTLEQMKTAAEKIYQLGPKAVIIKGGNNEGPLRATDLWFDDTGPQTIHTQTIDTPHTHGTGCTLSAAITANLAKGQTPFNAFLNAKKYVTEALKAALPIGSGTGPIGTYINPENLFSKHS